MECWIYRAAMLTCGWMKCPKKGKVFALQLIRISLAGGGWGGGGGSHLPLVPGSPCHRAKGWFRKDSSDLEVLTRRPASPRLSQSTCGRFLSLTPPPLMSALP